MTAILPLIIGALGVGVVAVFRLQTGVSTRLGDSADSQQISVVFSKDIAGAQYVTTDNATTPQCGTVTGTLLMKIDTNFNRLNGTSPVIVYELAQNTVGNTLAYNLVRLSCPTETSTIPTSTTTLAVDVASAVSSALTISCTGVNGCSVDPSTGWLSTKEVSKITYDVQGQQTNYNYTLAASPANSITSATQGSPDAPSADTTCNTADPNTGSLSANLCFVDFSQLATNPALWAAATNGCATLSVAEGSSDTLFFCINISVTGGAYLAPTAVPNYGLAFLGGCYPINACTTPFYTGISGKPALWLNGYGVGTSTATITLTKIHLNLANGQPASGWQFVSADAESTDATNPEYITWSTPSATPLSPICNGESWDYCTTPDPHGNLDYWGNACLDDQAQVGLVQTNTGGQSQIQCQAIMGSELETSAQKNGAGMVSAIAPSSMTVTMGTNNGYQAITLGLLLSGIS